MRRKVHPGILKRYEFVWIWHHQQQKKKLLQNILTRFWELQVCKIDSLNSKNSKKNCPKLLPTVQLDLVELVKKELKVEPVGVDVEHLNPAGSEPLLPALGNKLGLSVDRILAPPVTSCLLCSKQLTKHHPPVQVSLLSLLGPSLASKYTWMRWEQTMKWKI